MDKRKRLEMTQSLFALSSSLLKFFLKAQDLINAESVPDRTHPSLCTQTLELFIHNFLISPKNILRHGALCFIIH